MKISKTLTRNSKENAPQLRIPTGELGVVCSEEILVRIVISFHTYAEMMFKRNFFHRRHAMIIKRTRFFPRQLKTKIYTMDSICSTDCSSGQKMSVQVAAAILSAQFLWRSCVLCPLCKSPQSLFVCFMTVYQITWTRMSVHDQKKIKK